MLSKASSGNATAASQQALQAYALARSAHPLVDGSVRLEATRLGTRLRGSVSCDDCVLLGLSVHQAGVCVAAASLVTESGERVDSFDIHTPPSLAAGSPFHLWLTLLGGRKLSWTSVWPETVAPSEHAPGANIQIQSPQLGQVLEGPSVEFRGTASVGPLRVSVNGLPAGQVDVVAEAFSFELSTVGLSSRVWVELWDAQQGHAAACYWRKVAPGRPSPLVSLGTNKTKRFTDGLTPPRVVVLGRYPSPTAEVYVLAPLAALAARGAVEVLAIDAAHTEPSTELLKQFVGAHVVVIRYLNPHWIQAVTNTRQQLATLDYLMDDDVTVAINDDALPEAYRKKMDRVARREFTWLFQLCDSFITTSRFLAARFACAKTVLLEPGSNRLPADLDHHQATGPFRLAFHATPGHWRDLEFIAPALRDLLVTHADTELEIVGVDRVPAALNELSNVTVTPPLSWEDYKQFTTIARAHIGLVPLLPSPYNLGKSAIKLHDVAALGAVGVFSDQVPYRDVVKHGYDGYLVENKLDAWHRTLTQLVSQRSELSLPATRCQRLSRTVGDSARLTRFWINRIGYVGSPDVD